MVIIETRYFLSQYATGSTKSRIRLYRMGITKYFDEVNQDFEIYGLLEGEWEEFKKI